MKCYDATIKATINDVLNNLSAKAFQKKLLENVVLRNIYGKTQFLNSIWNDFRDKLYVHEVTFAGCMNAAKSIDKPGYN